MWVALFLPSIFIRPHPMQNVSGTEPLSSCWTSSYAGCELQVYSASQSHHISWPKYVSAVSQSDQTSSHDQQDVCNMITSMQSHQISLCCQQKASDTCHFFHCILSKHISHNQQDVSDTAFFPASHSQWPTDCEWHWFSTARKSHPVDSISVWVMLQFHQALLLHNILSSTASECTLFSSMQSCLMHVIMTDSLWVTLYWFCLLYLITQSIGSKWLFSHSWLIMSNDEQGVSDIGLLC
jgi:hypothetical protein